eukprot:4328835-Pyramimonas_sp.AAC.1
MGRRKRSKGKRRCSDRRGARHLPCAVGVGQRAAVWPHIGALDVASAAEKLTLIPSVDTVINEGVCSE